MIIYFIIFLLFFILLVIMIILFIFTINIHNTLLEDSLINKMSSRMDNKTKKLNY